MPAENLTRIEAAERAEFERWHAADEEHARAWMQLGMLNQRFAAAAGPVRKARGLFFFSPSFPA